MKQLKSLILASFLGLLLGGSVHAGDMGNPGIKSPCHVGACSPVTSPLESTNSTPSGDGMTNQVIREILFALIAVV